MTVLRVIDRFLCRIEFGLLVLFLGSMVLLAFTQVVLRNFFGTSFVWADPIVRHLVLWAGFMGAALATSEERHISVDAFTKFFSPRTKHIAQVFTSLFAVVVSYYLGAASWTFLIAEKASGSEIVLSIPTWVALLIIPVGYNLLLVHFFVKLVGHVATAFGKNVETPR